MRFIELSPGMSVAKDSITAIERIEINGTTGSRVYIDLRTIETLMPYETILKFLEAYETDKQVRTNVVNSPKTNLWGGQHWAG